MQQPHEPAGPEPDSSREARITAHLSLAEQLARRYRRRGEPLADLVQAATVGLIKAVDRFDPTRGVPFEGYATSMILGELKRHFRDHTWSVRAPRRVQELYLELSVAVEDLTQRFGRSPDTSELAAHLGVPVEAVLEAMEAAHSYRLRSLDFRPTNETGQAREEYDLLDAGSTDPGFDLAESVVDLGPQLSALTPAQRDLLCLRFVRELTQVEIARRLHLSQMQVSRLLQFVIAQLRAGLGAAAEGSSGNRAVTS